MQTIVKHFFALLLLLFTQFLSDSESESAVVLESETEIKKAQKAVCSNVKKGAYSDWEI